MELRCPGEVRGGRGGCGGLRMALLILRFLFTTAPGSRSYALFVDELATASYGGTIFEHSCGAFMQSPVGALACLPGWSWHLREAVVEGESMANRVLPSGTKEIHERPSSVSTNKTLC